MLIDKEKEPVQLLTLNSLIKEDKQKFFTEIKAIAKKDNPISAESSLNIEYFARIAYSKPYVDRRRFIHQANSKIESNKDTRLTRWDMLDTIKLLNPAAPFYIALETIKFALCTGIEYAFGGTEHQKDKRIRKKINDNEKQQKSKAGNEVLIKKEQPEKFNDLKRSTQYYLKLLVQVVIMPFELPALIGVKAPNFIIDSARIGINNLYQRLPSYLKFDGPINELSNTDTFRQTLGSFGSSITASIKNAFNSAKQNTKITPNPINSALNAINSTSARLSVNAIVSNTQTTTADAAAINQVPAFRSRVASPLSNRSSLNLDVKSDVSHTANTPGKIQS